MAASLAEENLLVTDDFNRQVSSWGCSCQSHDIALSKGWSRSSFVCWSGFAPAYVHSSPTAGMHRVLQVTHELMGWVGIVTYMLCWGGID